MQGGARADSGAELPHASAGMHSKHQSGATAPTLFHSVASSSPQNSGLTTSRTPFASLARSSSSGATCACLWHRWVVSCRHCAMDASQPNPEHCDINVFGVKLLCGVEYCLLVCLVQRKLSSHADCPWMTWSAAQRDLNLCWGRCRSHNVTSFSIW
jgi:hypothetical protein